MNTVATMHCMEDQKTGNNSQEYGGVSMAEEKKQELTQEEINEARRKVVVERMYLNHFNNTLLEKGQITPEEHRVMKNWITTRGSSARTR